MVRNAAWAALCIAAITGCATQIPQADLLAGCQADRLACDKQRQTCVDSLERVSSALADRDRAHAKAVADLRVAEQSLEQCQSTATSESRKAESLEVAKADLEQRLQASIKQKDVQIELLNDQLSVRVLDRILFDSGSARIRGEGLAVLGQVATVLARGSERIRVEGHTDDVPISMLLKPRFATNWELSAARAASVVRFFQDDHQIDPTRMAAVGHAFYKPVAPNDSPENRQRNRRVEVVLRSVN